MTPLPKRRHSTRRSGKRKAVLNRKNRLKIGLVLCPHCKQPKKPHFACWNCGKY